MNKSTLRKTIYKKRKQKYLKDKIINPKKISNLLLRKKIKITTIGGYYPYNYEIDSLNILKYFEKKNYLIALPKISKNNKMNFFQWTFNDPLSINNYGIPEPLPKTKVYPEVLLIPLLAFDKELNRLGYGGGFYDRYLSNVPNNKKIIKIGLGFSFQKIDKLPTSQHDKKLDYVITEKNIF